MDRLTHSKRTVDRQPVGIGIHGDLIFFLGSFALYLPLKYNNQQASEPARNQRNNNFPFVVVVAGRQAGRWVHLLLTGWPRPVGGVKGYPDLKWKNLPKLRPERGECGGCNYSSEPSRRSPTLLLLHCVISFDSRLISSKKFGNEFSA